MIGDTNGLERWLGGRPLRRVQRPVPLDEGISCFDGRFAISTAIVGNKIRRQVYPAPSRRRQASRLGDPVGSAPGQRRQASHRLSRDHRRDPARRAIFGRVGSGFPPAPEAVNDLPAGDPSQAFGPCATFSRAASPSTTPISTVRSGALSRNTSGGAIRVYA